MSGNGVDDDENEFLEGDDALENWSDEVSEDGGEEGGGGGRRGPKMTKEEREESNAAAFLLANSRKVEMDMADEVGDDELPDLESVSVAEGGGAPRRGDDAGDVMRFARRSEAYNRDLDTVVKGIALNAALSDDPPFPFLPPDLNRRLMDMTPTEMASLAQLVRSHERINDEIEEQKAAGALMVWGLGGVAWATEYGARELMGYDLTGYSQRVRAAASTKPALMHRLWRRYVEKYLGGGEGGNADLFALGMLMFGAAQDVYEINEEKRRRGGGGVSAGGGGETEHERNARMVREQMEREDSERREREEAMREPSVEVVDDVSGGVVGLEAMESWQAATSTAQGGIGVF